MQRTLNIRSEADKPGQTPAAAVNMDVLRSIETRITELKGGNSRYNIIYFNQIRPAIANSTYLSFSLYHRFGF